ncbi:50S ribosomal protein L24 [Candidatus Aenigmatarchaeota archaeon]
MKVKAKKYSPSWKSSTQIRKQRKYRYNAPMHIRQKLISAHLSSDLKKEYKKRSMPLKKGDEVKLLRGTYKGKKGKITKIDLKRLKVYIDNVKRKKPSGQEIEIAIEPSNVLITSLELSDMKRVKFRKKVSKEKKPKK